MAEKRLENVRIAALVTDGFEEIELVGPREVLEDEGAIVHIITPIKREREEEHYVQAWNHDKPSDKFYVDAEVDEVDAEDYDAVLLPGGVVSSDKLRADESVKRFLLYINDADKPIMAIGHGVWTMISAGILLGRLVTGSPTIKDDILNAEAIWSEEQIAVDENFVTAKNPHDLGTFNKIIVEMLSQLDVSKLHQHALEKMEGEI